MRKHPPYRPPGPFVVPSRVDPAGVLGPTPAAARGPRWVRTSPGHYLSAEVDRSSPEQRIAEAAARLPAGGAVTGWAGLRLHGAAFLDGLATDGRTRRPVPLRVPPDCHPRPVEGVRWVRGEVPRLVRIRGLPCLPARECTLDAMRLAEDVGEAVVVLDMAAAARLTSVERVRALLASRSWCGVPGVPQVRAALTLADEDSVSPPETRLRMVWQLDAGLPRPLVNPPVFDRGGRLLGHPDLLDAEAGLAVEYDGEDHRRADRHSADVDREARFREAGLEVTRATGRDLRNPDALVARLRAARARAPFTKPADRRWTTTPPPWFELPLPADVVLDLRGIDL